MNRTEDSKLVGRVLRVNRLHRSLAEKYTREKGVHRSQYSILMYLLSCSAPPSQKEIAAVFEVTPAAVALSLKKMEQDGLVLRIPSPEDSRVNLISVSDKGKKIMEENREFFERTDKQMLACLTDEEKAILASILDKCAQNLMDMGARDDRPPYCKGNSSEKGSSDAK